MNAIIQSTLCLFTFSFIACFPTLPDEDTVSDVGVDVEQVDDGRQTDTDETATDLESTEDSQDITLETSDCTGDGCECILDADCTIEPSAPGSRPATRDAA